MNKPETKLWVYQIDAWKEPDNTWRYNNSIEIATIAVNGEPTSRKLLRALREKGITTRESIGKIEIDDLFIDSGTWCVVKKSDGMPLFDLQEFK